MAKSLRKLRRMNEMLTILIKNGFLELMWKMGPKGFNFRPEALLEIEVSEGLPYRLRRMLEELGPTFIKIGQLLGTRPDLVPRPIIEELNNLYDSAASSSFSEIKNLIESELGLRMEDVFLHFEPEPIASASIAQVHRAVLKNGDKVAVKVQHPGIEKNIKIDFEILHTFARFIENEFASAKFWQPVDHLKEFEEMIMKELDFRIEAKNHQTVLNNFAGDRRIKIPKVYHEYTTKRVMTLEFIEGIKLSYLEAPELKRIDKRNIAKLITLSMVKQIFEDRIFHADPSPGNLMVMDSNTIAYLDFGAVGQITPKRRESVVHLVLGFTTGDVDRAARSLVELCNVVGELDEKSLVRDLDKILNYMQQEKKSIGDPIVFDRIIKISNKHNMLLYPDFMLITRALYQFEGLCRKLDPDYEPLEILAPYMKNLIEREMASPQKQLEMFKDAVEQYIKLARRLPGRLNTILRKIESSDLKIKTVLVGLQDLQEYFGKQVSRFGFTVITASILIGFSIIISTNNRALIADYALVCAIVIMIWVIITILSSDLMRK
jgi:ubiquinone biosynthesis protein